MHYPQDKLDELDIVIAAEIEEAPVFHSLYMNFEDETDPAAEAAPAAKTPEPTPKTEGFDE